MTEINKSLNAIIYKLNCKVIKISCGQYHYLTLLSNGQVYSNGFDDQGQLSIPNEHQGHFNDISAGGQHNLFLAQGGFCQSSGSNKSLQCDIREKEQGKQSKITAGQAHSLLLTVNGQVITAGKNKYGQCNVSRSRKNQIDVSAGQKHSLLLNSNNFVIGLGDNKQKQIDIPHDIQGRVVKVAAGDEQTGMEQFKANPNANNDFKVIEGVTAMHKKGTKGVRIHEFVRQAKKHQFFNGEWKGALQAKWMKIFQKLTVMNLFIIKKDGSGTKYKPDIRVIKKQVDRENPEQMLKKQVQTGYKSEAAEKRLAQIADKKEKTKKKEKETNKKEYKKTKQKTKKTQKNTKKEKETKKTVVEDKSQAKKDKKGDDKKMKDATQENDLNTRNSKKKQQDIVTKNKKDDAKTKKKDKETKADKADKSDMKDGKEILGVKRDADQHRRDTALLAHRVQWLSESIRDLSKQIETQTN